MIFHCRVINLPRTILLEKPLCLCLCLSVSLSFSQQMSVVNSSRYWGGIVCPDPHSFLGFGLPWACIGSVYTIATTVSSLWAATLLRPAGNVSCSYLLPLHLDSFCLLFYNDPFSLGGRLYVLYLQD